MTITPSERSTVRRRAERGAYERELVDAILDEGLVCHLGIAVEGQPFVIPTTYARVGDIVYVHGSPASRLLRALSGDIDACLTVTLLDGLVMARSAFHHSMNYRSVVVLGRATVVDDLDAKASAMDALVEHIAPGRSSEARRASEKELKATLVLALPLDECSAKVRTGPPIDDDEDLVLPVWAGVLPLRTVPGEPVADAALADGTAVPPSVRAWRAGS